MNTTITQPSVLYTHSKSSHSKNWYTPIVVILKTSADKDSSSPTTGLKHVFNDDDGSPDTNPKTPRFWTEDAALSPWNYNYGEDPLDPTNASGAAAAAPDPLALFSLLPDKEAINIALYGDPAAAVKPPTQSTAPSKTIKPSELKDSVKPSFEEYDKYIKSKISKTKSADIQLYSNALQFGAWETAYNYTNVSSTAITSILYTLLHGIDLNGNQYISDHTTVSNNIEVSKIILTGTLSKPRKCILRIITRTIDQCLHPICTYMAAIESQNTWTNDRVIESICLNYINNFRLKDKYLKIFMDWKDRYTRMKTIIETIYKHPELPLKLYLEEIYMIAVQCPSYTIKPPAVNEEYELCVKKMIRAFQGMNRNLLARQLRFSDNQPQNWFVLVTFVIECTNEYLRTKTELSLAIQRDIGEPLNKEYLTALDEHISSKAIEYVVRTNKLNYETLRSNVLKDIIPDQLIKLNSFLEYYRRDSDDTLDWKTLTKQDTIFLFLENNKQLFISAGEQQLHTHTPPI